MQVVMKNFYRFEEENSTLVLIALSFFFQFFLFLGMGLLTLRLCRASILTFSQTLLIGMCASSLLILISAFYTSLGGNFELFLIALALLGIFFGRRELEYLFRFKKYYFGKVFWFWAIVLLFGISFAPYILDHFGYYVPTLSVLNAQGIQQGVANIELVLGQQSLWHFLQAGMDNSIDTYLRLNGFLLIWYLIYAFERKQMNLLVFLPFFLLFSQSPSPDLAIYILALYVINEWYFGSRKNLGFLLCIAAWAFYIKATVFWLPLWVGIQIIYGKLKNNKPLYSLHWLVVVLVGCIMLYKGYLTSSNIVFPLSDFYIESAWKPDDRIIAQSSEFALQKGYNFEYSYSEIEHFSLTERLMNWLQLDGFKGKLNLCIVLITILFLYGVTKYKKKKYYLLSIVLVLKLGLVFWISGQQRFMWDALLVMILLAMLQWNRPKTYTSLSVLGTFLFLLVFSFPQIVQNISPSFHLGKMMMGIQSSQIVYPTQYGIHYSEYKKVGNLNFRMPKNYPFLYDTQFVALSESDLEYYLSLGVFPQWVDDTIIMKKLDAQSTKELEMIVNQKTAL